MLISTVLNGRGGNDALVSTILKLSRKNDATDLNPRIRKDVVILKMFKDGRSYRTTALPDPGYCSGPNPSVDARF